MEENKEKLTFETMEDWSFSELLKKRNELQQKLGDLIQKRDILKAEILYLQKRIKNFYNE